MPKIEPIELFAELTKGGALSVAAGEMHARKDGLGWWLSIRFAHELSAEAMAYKMFFHTAMALASLVERKEKGVHVSKPVWEWAQDEYVKARNTCQALDKIKPIHEIRREKL